MIKVSIKRSITTVGTTMAMVVLLLFDDLLFSAKIKSKTIHEKKDMKEISK
jgi:hypothetical protein